MPAFRFVLVLLTLAVFARSVSAQTTYWLPTIESTATEKMYKYGTKLPDAVGAWLAQKGKKATRRTDGGERSFIEATVDWDTKGQSNPMGGMISLHVPNGYGYGWMPFSSELKGNTAVAAAFDAAIVGDHNTWRVADLFVLVSQGNSNPNVTLRVPISQEDQIRARMRALAESTVQGQFYPNDVQIPANLDAMRREIIALGNLGRHDPNYRRGNKYANDLTKEYATTDQGQERIFRNNQTPPYFNDLVLHPKLNEACQFMAEYYARTNGNAQMPKGRKHDAPGATWKGAKMDTFGDRLKYFAPGVGSAGEGLAGAGGADSAPTTWMTTETHYRPWFNIGHDVKSMGIGAARTKDGWYFCKAGGTELPGGAVQPVSPPVTQRQTGAPATSSSSPAPSSNGFPLRPGTKIEQNRKYLSQSGKHYLVFQPDGNLVVYTAANQFVWGLNTVTAKFNEAKTVTLQPDGNLVVHGPNRAYIWSALNSNPDPGAFLTLTDDGALVLMSGRTNAPMWFSKQPKPTAATRQPLKVQSGRQYAQPRGDKGFLYVKLTHVPDAERQYRYDACPVPGEDTMWDTAPRVITVADALAQKLTPLNKPCDVNQAPMAQ